MNFYRRKTKVINLGGVKIGYGYPVSIQSMTKTATHDIKSCLRQIDRLKDAGCDIVRIAIKDEDDIKPIGKIIKESTLAIEADIHFNWQFAVKALECGVDGIRLNPGNIFKEDQLRPIVKLAKKRKAPIRVGINSGSLRSTEHRAPSTCDMHKAMVKSALDYIKILEKMDFNDIMISLKSSDVRQTVDAYRLIAERCDYPLHLGVTATGIGELAVIKSAIGIGSLLLDGIGDTIRVSLTDDPVREVETAKEILSAVGLRKEPIEILSCPTCGRIQVDLRKLVKDLEVKLSTINYKLSTRPLKVAVMGCEVNGPGEAKIADIGIACGKDSGVLFRNGKIIKRLSGKELSKELVKEVQKFMKD